jgi:CRISPR-associated endonuclease/helicase Cas3
MAKPKHGTSGGVELADEVVDRLAKEAEEGYDTRKLRRRRGRPSMGSEAATVFPVRLEPELRDALNRAAMCEHTTPSELVRRAIRAYLCLGSAGEPVS